MQSKTILTALLLHRLERRGGRIGDETCQCTQNLQDDVRLLQSLQPGEVRNVVDPFYYQNTGHTGNWRQNVVAAKWK